jgi:predicted DNA-binding WGR domain protein
MTAVSLHRTDPARRMRRFYLLDVQPDLFGEWSFIREWGRAGQPGQVWAVPFPTEAEATRGGAYAFRGGNGSRTGGGSMRSWMACSSRTRGACAAGMSGLPASYLRPPSIARRSVSSAR